MKVKKCGWKLGFIPVGSPANRGFMVSREASYVPRMVIVILYIEELPSLNKARRQ